MLVPGLWMPAHSMAWLRRGLRHSGYCCTLFGYVSTRRSLEQNAAALAERLTGIAAPRVNFVAHSLGGLLIRQLFHDFPEQRPGRVVTLGTPHAGSFVARHLAARGAWVARAIGQSLPALDGRVPEWHAAQALGVIAGDRPIGLGRLFAPLPRPHDGTVALAETLHPGAADHVVLPVTHLSMLISPAVLHQTRVFLREGRFARTAGH